MAILLDHRISFEGTYLEEESNTITHYFDAPISLWMELRGSVDADAVGMTISVEVPNGQEEARHASICISQYKRLDEDTTENFGWEDIDLPYEEIEVFLDLADKSNKEMFAL